MECETAGGDWAEVELGAVALGDARLTSRLVALARSLARAPDTSLPQALPKWSELKAAHQQPSAESKKLALNGGWILHVLAKCHGNVVTHLDESATLRCHQGLEAGAGNRLAHQGTPTPGGYIATCSDGRTRGCIF